MVRCSRQFLSEISIHAPPRGATNPAGFPINPTSFQFTPLREGRRALPDEEEAADISIHAPPRGATGIRIAAPMSKDFNSRPSARGDRPFSDFLDLFFRFQFTPLREGRRRRL